MAALFDTIHDNALSKRAEPATLEEFVEFGLQPEDYTHYVGLQMRVQGEFMTYGCTLADTRHPAITELISFCHEKKLIEYGDCCNEAYFCSEMISCSFDADYRHDWLRYPRNPAEFRLAVERRLSKNWDAESAYILDTFEDTSTFYDMGYTVSQTAGLSAVRRQRILKCAIDTGKASKYDVMRFLRQRMNINGMKAGNEIAFQKWKDDYNFIRSL